MRPTQCLGLDVWVWMWVWVCGWVWGGSVYKSGHSPILCFVLFVFFFFVFFFIATLPVTQFFGQLQLSCYYSCRISLMQKRNSTPLLPQEQNVFTDKVLLFCYPQLWTVSHQRKTQQKLAPKLSSWRSGKAELENGCWVYIPMQVVITSFLPMLHRCV